MYTGTLAHWVALEKKGRLGSEAGMQTCPTLAACWHQRIGHLSKEKIVLLTNVLEGRLCYTGAGMGR